MKFKSTTNLGEIAPRLAFIDNSKGIAINPLAELI